MSASAGTHAWLAPLLARYRRVRADRASGDEAFVEAFNSLRLAATADARLAALEADVGAAVDQLVVLGPTQAGKSTLVDALLDARVAGISALAGHTVHAQAFAADVASPEALLPILDALMTPLERVDLDALRRDALDAWSWHAVRPGPNARVRPGVVWDTPDFDSLASGTYREAVLAAAGLADRIVLATSKDKYGDRSVWDVLALVRGLGTPLCVVINKLDEADEATVLGAFARHHRGRFDAPPPPIVALPWNDAVRGTEARVDLTLPEDFRKADARSSVASRRAALERFVAARRDAWLAPLRAEVEARALWDEMVTDAEHELSRAYARRWLDDPDRYDTFERTLAELLTLLEIPGLARTLGRARQAVTWPARTLFGLGRSALGREPAPRADREAEVLLELHDETVTALRERVLERVDGARDVAWWTDLERALVAGRHERRARWIEGTASVRAAMAPRIEAAARELHERLEAQPALLNTLRATRVTTDAAGVALAFKSGGLAPSDLVLAPAMLSITTLLTESALGRWLEAVKRRLKREQAELVRTRLVEGVLGADCRAVADAARGGRLSDGALEPALLRELERARS